MKMYFLLFLTAGFLTFQSAPAAVMPMPRIDHPYDQIQALFTALPSGTQLTEKQFLSALGADVADYLDLIGAREVLSTSDKITVNLKSTFDGTTPKGNNVQMAPTLTFNCHTGGPDSLSCRDIKGIRVKTIWLLGWMPIKSLRVNRSTTGDTTFEITIETLVGAISRKMTVDQNGNILH